MLRVRSGSAPRGQTRPRCCLFCTKWDSQLPGTLVVLGTGKRSKKAQLCPVRIRTFSDLSEIRHDFMIIFKNFQREAAGGGYIPSTREPHLAGQRPPGVQTALDHRPVHAVGDPEEAGCAEARAGNQQDAVLLREPHELHVVGKR